MAHPARCDRCAKKIWLCDDTGPRDRPDERDLIIANLFHPNEKVRQKVRRGFPPEIGLATGGEILDFFDAAERLMRLSNQCAPPGPLDAMAVLAGGEKALKQEIQKIVAEAGQFMGQVWILLLEMAIAIS